MSLDFDPTQNHEDNNLVDYLIDITDFSSFPKEEKENFIKNFTNFKNQAKRNNQEELLKGQISGALSLFAGNNLPKILNILLKIPELDANPWWQPNSKEKFVGTIEQLFKTNDIFTNLDKKESLNLCLKNNNAPELFQHNAEDVVKKIEEQKIILTDILNNNPIPRKKDWSNKHQDEITNELEKEYVVIKILEKAGQELSEENISDILNDKSFSEIFEKYKWCCDNSKLSTKHFKNVASLFNKEREQDTETIIEKIYNRSQIVEIVPPQRIKRDGNAKVHPEPQPESSTKPQPTQEKKSFWDLCCPSEGPKK